jgi:putative pre-16S rRNA nuclease
MAPAPRAASDKQDSPTLSGRILAIDYGRRRIGLAISDELGVTARPLAAMERKNRRDDIRRLRVIAREHKAQTILVGSPVHLDGHSGEMADEAARFAARLGKQLGLPVEMRDERLTSWAAEELGRELAGAKNSKRAKVSVDSLAAAIFLREHLVELNARGQTSPSDEG